MDWLDKYSTVVEEPSNNEDNSWLDKYSIVVEEPTAEELLERQRGENPMINTGVPIGTGGDEDLITPTTRDPYQGSLTMDINQNMWDGMPYEDAERMYQQIKDEHGHLYESKDGQKYHIPMPTRSPFNSNIMEGEFMTRAGENPIQAAGGMVSNVIREGAKLGAAGLDLLAGNDGEITEFVEKNIPIYPTRGISKSVEEAGSMAFGAAKANSLYNMIKVLNKSGGGMARNLGQSAGRGLAVGTGATIPAPSDTATLFAGDNALMKSDWLTVDLPDDENRAVEVIEDKINILTDTMIASGVFGTGIEAATKAGGFVNNAIFKKITAFGSDTAREDKIVSDILNKFSLAYGADTPAERQKLMGDVINGIKQNSREVIESSTEGITNVDFMRDTMSALEVAIKNGDMEYAQRIVQNASKSPEEISAINKRLTATARELRRDKTVESSPFTQEALGRPDKALDTFREEVDVKFGGDESLEKGLRGTQDLADRMLKPSRQLVEGTAEALETEIERTASLLDNDPTFRDKLNQAGKALGYDTSELLRTTGKESREKLKKLNFDMTEMKNSLYAAIPDTATLKKGDMEFVLQEVSGSLPRRLSDKIKSSEGNFRVLYNEVLPELRKLSNRAYKSQDQELIEDVEIVRNFINRDGIEYLIENGDEEVAEAALKARNYYRDEYSPIWREGELSRFDQAVGKSRFDKVDGPRDLRQSFERAMSSNEPEFGGQLVDAMSRKEYSGDPSEIVDYISAKSAKQILDQIRSGREDIDYGAMYSTLDGYSELLKEEFPEQAARLEAFTKSMQNRQTNVKSLTKQLEKAERGLRDAETEVYGNVLKDFFTKQGISIRQNDNAFKSFSKLLSGDENQSKINDIILASEGNDNVRNALKVAYIRHTRNKLSMTNDSSTGSSRLSVGQYKNIAQGSDRDLEYGRMIFSDSPEIQDMHEELLTLSKQISDSVTSVDRGGSININSKDLLKDTKGVAQMIVTMIYGPLSRIGARINSASAKVLGELDPAEQNKYIMDKIYADPDLFIRAARRVKESSSNEPSERREIIVRYLINAGIYGEEDEENLISFDVPEADLETEEMFNE